SSSEERAPCPSSSPPRGTAGAAPPGGDQPRKGTSHETTSLSVDRDPVHGVGAAGYVGRGGAYPSAAAAATASPPSLSARRRLPARVGGLQRRGSVLQHARG